MWESTYLVKIVVSLLFLLGVPDPAKNGKNNEIQGDYFGGVDDNGALEAAALGRGGEGGDGGGETRSLTLVAVATQVLVAVATDWEPSLANDGYVLSGSDDDRGALAGGDDRGVDTGGGDPGVDDDGDPSGRGCDTGPGGLVGCGSGARLWVGPRSRKELGATRVVAVGLVEVVVGLRLLLRPEAMNSTLHSVRQSYDESRMLGKQKVTDGEIFLVGLELDATHDSSSTMAVDPSVPVVDRPVVTRILTWTVVPEEQEVLRERDAGSALPEEGVGMGAHEKEGEDRGFSEDEGAEPVQVGPQSCGPRNTSLLTSYLTHKAPVIWTSTERLTLPNANPMDRDLIHEEGSQALHLSSSFRQDPPLEEG
ncbi:hypothetical protein V2J09_006021 [Rumex salicifolius]